MIKRMLFVAWIVALAGCSATPADPHETALLELSDAYKPYAECVRRALESRQDFDGQLAEMVVNRGQDGQLGVLAERYLKTPKDAEGLDAEARVAAARSRLVSLGRYGAGQSPMQGAERVRRTMSMVETMVLIAAATDTTCEIPENLISSMEKAKNEYL